ncbi:hypothetical protein GCM10011506_30090 [Marivirga lumbricoides]|uniref:Uncharacterized protein n=1 Tax=Marivirga lumbricoides TaxID=1046115 RepID=A0ABQ1MPF7_9BACT|nr:hypothetical protein GCM10011506_30090 [Marivirga lumbricoides]
MMRQNLEALGDDHPEMNQSMIKRRLIPIEMQITEKGQYQTFQQKIPFQVHKVVGIIFTHNTPSEIPFASRVYVGSAPNAAISQSLIYRLRNEKTTGATLCLSVHVPPCEKLYYAQPHKLGKYNLFINGRTGKFKEPVTISLRDFWTGSEEYYWVWESKYEGCGTVELCVSADSRNEDEDY